MLRISRLLAGLSIGIAAAGLVSAQTIQINRENKTIAISTTDEATATADIAAITIGFEIFGADSLTVSADGGKLSHAILEALHKAGVEDKAIESTGQGVERNKDFDEKETPEQRAKEQYIFRQSWEVSVSPQLAAEVIRVSIAEGANKSGAIEWRLSDRKALQAKAAEAALVKARAVASQMADGLHVRLGELMYASNETPNTQLYFTRPPHGMAMMNTMSASVSSVISGPPLEIRPQTIREEATVYAVFAID
ncbi:MAG: SIMPL domain-containing protein [Terracidiphilus sp.]|jgi:uncharacterized protein YggE